MHSGTGPQTIKGLYQLAENSKDPPFYLSAKSHDLLRWPFPTRVFKQRNRTKFSQGVLTQRMILPAVNNPSFDIVGFEQNRAGGNKCEY